MTLNKPYVVARGASGHATLQHKVNASRAVGEIVIRTDCGADMSNWSVSYTAEKLPAILCKRCEP